MQLYSMLLVPDSVYAGFFQAELAESRERYAVLEKNLRQEVENMEKQYKDTKDVIEHYQQR